MYNPLPLHHANCLSISAPAMLLCGGCLAFPDRFHASTWWQDLVACGVTAVHMQGIIPNILLKLPPCAEERAHEARFALCAGIEPSHHEPFERRFGLPVVEMWAMSETGRFLTDNHEPRRIDTAPSGARCRAWRRGSSTSATRRCRRGSRASSWSGTAPRRRARASSRAT